MYKTPGVYIEEISLLPPSVAPVETAIPAFIGFVTKRIRNNETIPLNTPTRVTSLLEFEEWFGGPFIEFYNVTITDPPSGSTEPGLAAAYRATSGLPAPYILYYHVQMFYANGGGPCWIVPAGDISQTDLATLPTPANLPGQDVLDAAPWDTAVDACEEIDEVTLLVVPEITKITVSATRRDINDAMLQQCGKLQDRFAILDVLADPTDTPFNDAVSFRSNEVSTQDLKYGAAYYPALKTVIPYKYTDDSVHIIDNRTADLYDGERLSSIISGLEFGTTNQIRGTASVIVRIVDNTSISGDSLVINGVTIPITQAGSASLTAQQLANDIDTNPSLSATISAVQDAPATTQVVITADTPGSAGNSFTISYIDSGTGPAVSLHGIELTPGQTTLTVNFRNGSDGIDTVLYNRIRRLLDKNRVNLYPSGAMAGIYARIDESRGVWKAPANTSVNMVSGLTVLVTDDQQRDLNVDTVSGKSINVVRHFHGKGQIVWGARTLAGNDNEWRYINVRRFYNFAEESIKKATYPFVFEPNDANTWLRVKSMIENFLTGLWREGALAGATTAEAFFVKVGLGQTMTAQDILEGRMNVEIGMAVARPAEFIILKFSHKMQES